MPRLASCSCAYPYRYSSLTKRDVVALAERPRGQHGTCHRSLTMRRRRVEDMSRRVPRLIGSGMSAESFNACVYLVDRQVQAGLGDHPAVTGPAGSLTYAELAARAAELAAGFQAAGVRPEERVLLVATDRPETVVTFLA